MTRRPTSSLIAVFLATLLSHPTTVRAQDSSVSAARAHFDAGQSLYEKGEFDKATEEFLAAHAARPFAAFLFNAAVCREKAKDYPKAVELFRRYLADEPKATDRAAVEKRIAALEVEIAKGENATNPATDQVAALPQARTKGVVLIESRPPGATIRLDDRGAEPFAKTPWSGEFPDDRPHTLYLELRGYKSPGPTTTGQAANAQFAYFSFDLSEDPELGVLVVTSNVPDAYLYLDGAPGVWARVADDRNIKRGKHKLLVKREGYLERLVEVDIRAGQLNTIPIDLEPAAIGFIRVRGIDSAAGAKVKLDGKEACRSVPCRFEAPEGRHRLGVVKSGKKSFSYGLTIERMTEATLTVSLADQPARFWPVTKHLLWMTAFGVGGGLSAKWLDDDTARLLTEEPDPNAPKYNPSDPDYELGANYASDLEEYDNDKEYWDKWSSWVYGGIGALGAAYHLSYAVWELTREKGPPSKGSVTSRDLSWAPFMGPGVAGVGAEGRF